MKIGTVVVLLISHGAAVALGFALGIYALPILTAPPAPTQSEVAAISSQAVYTAQFTRDLEGSDAFHWGEGEVSLGSDYITLVGSLAPGPDYMLYMSPEFVETEAEFEQLKPSMLRVGDVKTFDNFMVPLSPDVDLDAFNTVIVWCESFGEFITSAQYR